MFKAYLPGRIIMGRLERGDDLAPSLTALCKSRGLKTAYVSVIGAVETAWLGYYDQKKKNYSKTIVFNRKMEIASCIGNVSWKEGRIFIHAHCVLSGPDGTARGGHLLEGTLVFAAEFTIIELNGPALTRMRDAGTGLYLWK